jgi:hypothetical protein
MSKLLIRSGKLWLTSAEAVVGEKLLRFGVIRERKSAFCVTGWLQGEGETQIFLKTARTNYRRAAGDLPDSTFPNRAFPRSRVGGSIYGLAGVVWS